MPAIKVAVAAVLVVASMAFARPAAAGTAELVQQLDAITSSFPGGAGLWIADPTSRTPLYSHNPDEPIITASLYKLGVLMEAERRVDTGELHYGDIITIQ